MVGRGWRKRDTLYTCPFPWPRPRDVPGLSYPVIELEKENRGRGTDIVVAEVVVPFICTFI